MNGTKWAKIILGLVMILFGISSILAILLLVFINKEAAVIVSVISSGLLTFVVMCFLGLKEFEEGINKIKGRKK